MRALPWYGVQYLSRLSRPLLLELMGHCAHASDLFNEPVDPDTRDLPLHTLRAARRPLEHDQGHLEQRGNHAEEVQLFYILYIFMCVCAQVHVYLSSLVSYSFFHSSPRTPLAPARPVRAHITVPSLRRGLPLPQFLGYSLPCAAILAVRRR